MSQLEFFQHRAPTVRASFRLPGKLAIDNFCGGGGATLGIERALGRPVDIAINHDPVAIAMHQANHPETIGDVPLDKPRDVSDLRVDLGLRARLELRGALSLGRLLACHRSNPFLGLGLDPGGSGSVCIASGVARVTRRSGMSLRGMYCPSTRATTPLAYKNRGFGNVFWMRWKHAACPGRPCEHRDDKLTAAREGGKIPRSGQVAEWLKAPVC